jgi:osmotically-inducible protein OsmY
MRNPLKTSVVVIGLAVAGALAGCAQTATSESTGAYLDDSSITAKVKAAIFGDASLKMLDIHVDTRKNVVQLSGSVETPMMIARAGELAANVPGVRSVQNDLVLR